VVSGASLPPKTFVERFEIGRDAACEVHVPLSNVSRVHAAVAYEDGAWWVIDQDSTNGLYLQDKQVERAPVQGATQVRLGKDGPVLELAAEGGSADLRPVLKSDVDAAPPVTTPPVSTPQTSAEEHPRTQAPAANGRSHPPRDSDTGVGAVSTPSSAAPSAPTPQDSGSADSQQSSESAAPADASMSWYRRHYLTETEGDEPAGERTQFIRQAYRQVQKKQRRTFTSALVAAAFLVVLVGAYAGYQHWQNQRLQAAAADLFYEMKEQDVRLAQLARIVEETGGEELTQLLAEMQVARQRMAAQYEGYVRELGVYRNLTDTERLIYRVARIFGESEFEIPAGFVRAVQHEIDNYWLAHGRSRWLNAVAHAEAEGYTPVIVSTMQAHGLPPEMYYLALQESNLNVNAVGPETRWGIAKGMWQFIPSTGRSYGLRVGPREDARVVDPQDDRHDFERSTQAAARYQAEIYSTLAQASGLLVLASYNWGENGVVRRLNRLFEGIPENPRERSYWRFLQAYEDRMPQETKDYVLRIFAAAVIGQDPAHFGLDAPNPLLPYMEAPTDGQADAMPGSPTSTD